MLVGCKKFKGEQMFQENRNAELGRVVLQPKFTRSNIFPTLVFYPKLFAFAKKS